MRGLTDAVILITGALNGIGLSAARRFHAEGARVILSDRLAPDSDQARLVMADFRIVHGTSCWT